MNQVLTPLCLLYDGYVTEDDGTNVVHQAHFGENDYRVCLENIVIILLI